MVALDDAPIRFCLGTDQRCAVEQFVDSARRYFGPRLLSVRIFGSVARGEAGPSSDVDLALLLVDEPTRADRRRMAELATEAGGMSDLFTVISPLLLSQERFARLLRGERRLALDLEHEGIPL